MATGQVPEVPASAEHQSSGVTTGNPLDTISLNILSPAPEVRGGRLLLTNLQLDINLLQLKTMIQGQIEAAPPPERQRLIYLGHPLLNNNSTLRQIFRPHTMPDPPSTYTIHLMLPPSGTASEPPGDAFAVPNFRQQITQPTIPSAATIGHFGHDHAAQHQAIAQAHTAQVMLQNQINLLHQQLAAHNPALATGHQQAQIPNNGIQVTYQVNGGQPMQMPIQSSFFTGAPNLPVLQNLAAQPSSQGPAGYANAQNPAASAGSGQLPQTILLSHGGMPGHPSIPGNTRIQERIGPNGERIRTVITETGSTQAPGPFPSATDSNTRPSSSGRSENRPANSTATPVQPTTIQGNQRLATATATLPTTLADQMRQPVQPFTTRNATAHVIVQPTSPMAWILSSPTGPYALLFAPGHGYFFSPLPSQSSRTESPSRSSTHPHAHHHPSPTANAAPNAPVANDAPLAAPLVLRDAPAQAQPQAANNANDDMFAFLVQRGWLFLRLYLFIFIVSEPDSWRRWILLSIATIVCLLPADNPVYTLLARVRRLVDQLVGPAVPPARDVRAGAARAQAAFPARAGPNREPGGGPRVGNAPPAPHARIPRQRLPTPEETAARLVRERAEQNPNMLREALERVERGLTLFFASLVPGVGERHVRAREEARREEQQRVAAEAERERVEIEAAQANGEASGPTNEGSQLGTREGSKDATPGQGSSVATGAEVGVDADEMRIRGPRDPWDEEGEPDWN